jgi:hypothetical protein
MEDATNLPDDIGQLKRMVVDYHQHIEYLQNRLNLLLAALHAPKSEKIKTQFQNSLVLPFLNIPEAEPVETPAIEVPCTPGPNGAANPCRTICRVLKSFTTCPKTKRSAPAESV